MLVLSLNLGLLESYVIVPTEHIMLVWGNVTVYMKKPLYL